MNLNLAKNLTTLVEKKAEVAHALTPESMSSLIDAVKEFEAGTVDGGSKVVEAMVETLGNALKGVFGSADSPGEGESGDGESEESGSDESGSSEGGESEEPGESGDGAEGDSAEAVA